MFFFFVVKTVAGLPAEVVGVDFARVDVPRPTGTLAARLRAAPAPVFFIGLSFFDCFSVLVIIKRTTMALALLFAETRCALALSGNRFVRRVVLFVFTRLRDYWGACVCVL